MADTAECTDKFWVCTQGAAFNYTCPAGLFYNIEADECDYRQRIRACGGQPTTTTTPPPTQTNPPIDYDCSGKPDGFYAPIPCHSEYISCAGGRPVDRMTCPTGTVFDPASSQCDWPAVCGIDRESSTSGPPSIPSDHPLHSTTAAPVTTTQTTPPISYNCEGKADGNYMVDPTECSEKFWECADGRAFAHSCHQGLFYNVDNGFCDFHWNVHACRRQPSTTITPVPVTTQTSTTPIPTTTQAASQQTALNASSYNCEGKPDGVYMANTAECTDEFWMCAHGRTFNYLCDMGLFYNVETNECEHRQNIRACVGQPTTTTPVPVPTTQASSGKRSARYHSRQYCQYSSTDSRHSCNFCYYVLARSAIDNPVSCSLAVAHECLWLEGGIVGRDLRHHPPLEPDEQLLRRQLGRLRHRGALPRARSRPVRVLCPEGCLVRSRYGGRAVLRELNEREPCLQCPPSTLRTDRFRTSLTTPDLMARLVYRPIT